MADDPNIIGQREIQDLLKQVEQSASTATQAGHGLQPTVSQQELHALLDSVKDLPAAAAESMAWPNPAAAHPASPGDDIQLLLEQAEQALASVDQPVPAPDAAAFQLKDLSGSPATDEKATLDLLSDVEFNVRIELGRTDMYLEDVLKLRRGSVVALDKLAGDPVDIYVNGRLIARGEVLVLNDSFCVRVAELIAGDGVP
jgi:flagellar motor switch protein FliN/FliY